MSESRADRIAQYKEERRRQLSSQINAKLSKELSVDGTGGSKESLIRTTRASRLRADFAVGRINNHDSSLGNSQSPNTSNERKSSTRSSEILDKIVRKKCSSTCPEESPIRNTNTPTQGDSSRFNKRRRRVVQENSSPETSTTSTPKIKSSTKSQLAIHMENARRNSNSNSTQKETKLLNINNNSNLPKRDNNVNSHNSDKENIKSATSAAANIENSSFTVNSLHKVNTNRLNELSSLTNETLARLERLKLKNKHPSISNPSILKKKSFEDPSQFTETLTTTNLSPVSILKRKTSSSQSEELASSSTPPVTFSPSVKEPSTTNRKTGILKKRRSLDESLVLRRRSVSPKDSKSILKAAQKRRSSLEDLYINNSNNENNIQGILKRRSSKYDEESDLSFNSPQSILKRRSGDSSSAGSISGSSPHVSITTAVILAAASGAEIVLDQAQNIPQATVSVKPILKKKSLESDQNVCEFPFENAVPKPILKKKQHSVELEIEENKCKPILKSLRSFSTESESRGSILKSTVDDGKSSQRFTFGSKISNEVIRKAANVVRNNSKVSQLVTSFEKVPTAAAPTATATATGTIPKIRTGERYKTQPVTSEEYEASLNYVVPAKDHRKISSDSAFQSLLDGLEMEEKTLKITSDEKEIPQSSCKTGGERMRNGRFVTQPITLNEVQEASNKIPDDDPANLSFKERLRVFSQSINVSNNLKGKTPEIHVQDEGISCNDSGSDTEKNVSCEIKGGDKVSNKVSRSSSARVPTSSGASSLLERKKMVFKNELENLLKVGGGVKQRNEIRRSHTFSSGKLKSNTEDTEKKMPKSIAELQATLQRKGESEWRKRYGQNNSVDDELKFLKEKNIYNMEIMDKSSLLAYRKDELDAASKQWKCRVEKSDAEKFSVSGKMEKIKQSSTVPVNIPTSNEAIKKPPKAKRFKGKEPDSSSTPTSPEKSSLEQHSELKRSQSNPSDKSSNSPKASQKIITTRNVQIVKPDDFTFKNFFKNIEGVEVNSTVFSEEDSLDFDAVKRQSLLVQKKNVKVQSRRNLASKNPIKALSKRDDIKEEYTEVFLGIGERESKRLNIEKLAKSSSSYAVEALAGLASKEDFKNVPLKKGNSTTPSNCLPFKELMLIHVKGRRHVQLRLVEPAVSSINDGDCFLLITKEIIFVYTGKFSNIIEQSRASDVANIIQKTNDLGTKSSKIVHVNAEISNSNSNFWKLLNGTHENVTKAGNPTEDEVYESNILLTNMVYKLENDEEELVPVEQYWGCMPKYEMLTPTAVYLFDFGSEVYFWSGKNASSVEKSKLMRLAKEYFNEGFTFADCAVNPIEVAQLLGDRNNSVAQPQPQPPRTGEMRPKWTLFSKLTQHAETILFKEKFADWPDFKRLMQVKNSPEKPAESVDIRPIAPEILMSTPEIEKLVDLVVEGTHLGRGDTFFDVETNRIFQFETQDIKCWKIMENTYEPNENLGCFHDENSYIIRWRFRINVKGKGLSGKPSKHHQVGRDSTVFFYWQGCNSSINEKGVAALLTVELDSESAPQVRIPQGREPAAFLRLFNGQMVVRKGKSDGGNSEKKLFIIRGQEEEEAYLMEVKCDSQQLRSRSSFVLVNPTSTSASANDEIIIWHGAKSSSNTRKIVRKTVDKLMLNPNLIGLKSDFKLSEVEENSEDGNSFNRSMKISKNCNSYVSLVNDERDFNFEPRFFNFSSVSGVFTVQELICLHKSAKHSSPFPILQNQLYMASQPALFLVDNEYELWLWQGWWPENEDGLDQTGSGAVRWQLERKAAMKTAIEYWKEKKSCAEVEVNAKLAWAGLEPIEFKNLFPFWEDRGYVAKLQEFQDNREVRTRDLVLELELLSRTEFSITELMERPLPEGVDPTHLEDYLSAKDFEEVLDMSKEEFQELPSWKQTALKKERGLF